MPKSLAEGHIKLSIMSTKPAAPAAATLAELNAGIDAGCSILASSFRLGASGSDKVNEKSLCQSNNANALGATNFDGCTLTAFRYFDLATGAAEASGAGTIGDAVFQALKTKGARVWVAKRITSKLSTDAWAATDEYELFEVITDTSSDGELTGYIKKTVPLEVQEYWVGAAAA